jgi:hypothetical protein
MDIMNEGIDRKAPLVGSGVGETTNVFPNKRSESNFIRCKLTRNLLFFPPALRFPLEIFEVQARRESFSREP